MLPQLVETAIIEDPDRVKSHLEDIGLSWRKILEVRDAAYVHLVDTSPLMPINAPGTLAYHFGVRKMREAFCGKEWELDRSGGVESIVNASETTKVVYQNVDVACSRALKPKPRSDKGSNFELECQGNLFEFYKIFAPEQVKPIKNKTKIVFIMVDDRGAVEVSTPVVEGGKFSGFVERIFVSDGADVDRIDISPIEELPAPVDDFDISVRRR